MNAQTLTDLEQQIGQLAGRLKQPNPALSDLDTIRQLAQIGQRLREATPDPAAREALQNARAAFHRHSLPLARAMLDQGTQVLGRYNNANALQTIDPNVAEDQKFEEAYRAMRAAYDFAAQRLPLIDVLLPASASLERAHLQTLTETLGLVETLLTGLRKYRTVRSDVLGRLAQAERQERERAGTLAVGTAKAAADAARSAVDAEPAGSLLHGLYSTLAEMARVARERYAERHETPTTATSLGRLADVLVKLAGQAERDPDSMVTTFTAETIAYDKQEQDIAADSSGDTATITVTQALMRARNRYADALEKKVGHYVEQALEQLNPTQRGVAPDPNQAWSTLQAWDTNLPRLNDPRIVAVGTLQNLQLLINQTLQKVEPDYLHWQAADEAINRAQLQLETGNLTAADTHYREALGHYTHHARLTALGHAIAVAARKQLGELAAAAHENMRAGVWGSARLKIEDGRKLLPIAGDNLGDAGDRWHRALALWQLLDPLVKEDARPTPEADRTRLSALRDAYAADWNAKDDAGNYRWRELRERLTRAETLQNTDKLLKEAKAAFNDKSELTQLRELAASIAEQLAHPTAALTAAQKSELTRAQAKLNAWIGFAEARDEVERLNAPDQSTNGYERPVANATVIQAGLQAAQADADAKSAADAKGLPQALKKLEANNKEAAALLTRTAALLRERPNATQLRNQRRELETVSARSSVHRSELLTQLDAVRAQLAQLARRAIEGHIQRSDTYYKDLKVEEVQMLLEEYKHGSS